MSKKSLKLSWIILLIPHGAALIMGLIMALNPAVFLSGGFQIVVGQQLADFIETSAKVSVVLINISRLFGTMAFIVGFMGVIVTVMAYRKGEKWAWYLHLAGNTVGYGCIIISDSITGNIPIVITMIIFLVIAYIALIIGAKSILKKVST